MVLIEHKWVVFASAFSVSFFNFGLPASMGAMYVGMLDTFNAGRAKTALVQSLVFAFCLGFGVISGFLVSKFGIKVVTPIAAILTATGFFLSFFATSIYQLYGFISVITGIGFSTMYVSAVVCVGWTFTGSQKSIVLASQSIGTALSGFMWPFLLTASIEAYSLRGTCLILSGIFLNNIPFAIVFAKTKINSETESKILRSDTTMTNISDEKNTNHTSCSHTDSQIHDLQEQSPDKPDTKSHCNSSISSAMKGNGKQIYENGDATKDIASGQIIEGVTVSNKDNNTPEKHRSLSTVCCSKLLWLYIVFLLSCVSSIASIAGFLTVYQDINVNNGLTIAQSDLTFMSYALTNILSRLLPVIPARFPIFNQFSAPTFSSLLGAAGQLLFLTHTSFAWSVVAMGLTACADGGTTASLQAISFQILPTQYQAVGMGFIFTAMGIASSATGPIFGSIRDGTSSYQTVLISTSTVMFVSAVLSFVCLLMTSNCLRNGCNAFTRMRQWDVNTPSDIKLTY